MLLIFLAEILGQHSEAVLLNRTRLTKLEQLAASPVTAITPLASEKNGNY